MSGSPEPIFCCTRTCFQRSEAFALVSQISYVKLTSDPVIRLFKA